MKVAAILTGEVRNYESVAHTYKKYFYDALIEQGHQVETFYFTWSLRNNKVEDDFIQPEKVSEAFTGEQVSVSNFFIQRQNKKQPEHHLQYLTNDVLDIPRAFKIPKVTPWFGCWQWVLLKCAMNYIDEYSYDLVARVRFDLEWKEPFLITDEVIKAPFTCFGHDAKVLKKMIAWSRMYDGEINDFAGYPNNIDVVTDDFFITTPIGIAAAAKTIDTMENCQSGFSLHRMNTPTLLDRSEEILTYTLWKYKIFGHHKCGQLAHVKRD